MQQNRLLDKDLSLIDNKLVKYDFGYKNDVAELHIYDSTGKLINSNQMYTDYKPNSEYGLIDEYLQSLDIYPENDLKTLGYTAGIYKLYYNFLRKVSEKTLFVKTISSDRTEIVLTSNSLSNNEIEIIFNKLKSNFEDHNFIKNYLLNFDKNELYLVTNLALDTNGDVYDILLKLYTPLLQSISTKLLVSICEEIIQTNIIDIELKVDTIIVPKNYLKSANFDLDFDNISSVSTEYLNTATLTSNITLNSSVKSPLNAVSISLNINYENFNEFIHYGNAEIRIINFVYKVKQLESYFVQKVSKIGNTILVNTKISNIVTNFDDYEHFLYTSFSNKSYPKNSDGTLKSSISSDVITWLGDSSLDSGNSGILGDAKYYDCFNKDSLINNIPDYLIIDTRNKPFTIFCNMVGQHFDSIWIYSNKFTNLYESNNNLYKGISPDIVENVLKSFGVKLYNSMSNVDITNVADNRYNKEIYKRIFHNLPFLKKYKGTRNGLKQLINIFGIPDTLYRIYEYGSIKKGVNTIEHIDNIFNYCLTSNRLGYITAPYKDINTTLCPSTVLFRIKLNSKRVGTITTLGDFDGRDFNSLDYFTEGSILTVLGDFDGRDFSAGEFSEISTLLPIVITDYSEIIGKIKLNGVDYITIMSDTFNDNLSAIYLLSASGEISRKIYFELYKGDWTTISIDRNYDTILLKTTYTLNVGQIINNKLYTQNSSISLNNELVNITTSNMVMEIGKTLNYCFQKLIMFTSILNQDSFNAHVSNSTSIQGNSVNSFNTECLFYIPFGIDLKTYNHSVLNIMPTLISKNSFFSQVQLTNFENKINYNTEYDKIYYNSSNTLSTKRVTDKISIPTKSYYGNVLSSYKQIEKKDSNYFDYKFLDVVFSPTFEQDDDIINSLGNFNLDDYIGSPDDYLSTSYSSLRELRLAYLTKLTTQYNIKDYINMVNYIDNSLFKMVKDFVPISNNTSVGILIRQNILHRNKIKGVSINFEQFYINDIVLPNRKILAKLQNIPKDFDIYCKKNFDKINFNKFLSSFSKYDKSEFTTSLYNQNITFLNNYFEHYGSFDLKNKYGGIKVSSKLLNEYNNSDITLGKTYNITSYVDKIGLFTNISKNEIFDKKCNVQLKYLVDKNGSLTDINKLNKNFYDVQGIFQKDDTAVVSLFDNIKYSNQRNLDGNKKIFSSAYNYNPVLYFSDKDRYFKFDQLVDEQSTYFRYYENSSRDITGSKYIYDLFDTKDIDIRNRFIIGDTSNKIHSNYTITESGQYEFNVDVLLRISSINNNLSFKYNLTSYRNFVLADNIIDSISYIHKPTDIQYDNDGNQLTFPEVKPVHKPLEVPIIGEDSMIYFNNYWSNEKNSYNVSGLFIPYDKNRTWKLFEQGINNDNTKYRIYKSDDLENYSTGHISEIYDSNGNLEKLEDVYFDAFEETIALTLPLTKVDISFFGGFIKLSNIFVEQKRNGIIFKDASIIANGINNSYNIGEKIIFVLEQVYINDTTVNTIILENSSSVYSIKNNYNLKIGANDSLITSITNKTMSINSKLFDYIGKGTFNMSGSTLYTKYGDINDVFEIDNGDVIYLKDSKTSSTYYLEIADKKLVAKNIVVTFLNDLPSFVLKENITECVFINKIKDETNIVINHVKKPGDTSYGFIIPKNINPTFMANIDIITKEVKLKLLNDYTLNKNSI